MDIPFLESQQLCDLLEEKDNQLRTKPSIPAHLPDQPFVALRSQNVKEYLACEFVTPLLDRMKPHLWLLATQSSSHVSPLHQQIVRGREIVTTEDPELHLVWAGSHVYIKPLPLFLLSYAFWHHYLQPSSGNFGEQDETRRLFKAATGYLRTWHHLIRHKSDYKIAQDRHLIPEELTWTGFAAFITPVGALSDERVSPRYHFGELRLSRLNFWAKIFLRRWQFRKASWAYADYFARFYAPILFVFALVGVVLSAMQVGLAARPSWTSFVAVSAWFSVLSLLLASTITMLFLFALLVMTMREFVFALQDRSRKRHETDR